MNSMEISKLASQLSVEQIQNLSNEEVMHMVMERPGHPGQLGFVLAPPPHFRPGKHIAETMHALIVRMMKIDNPISGDQPGEHDSTH